MTTITLNPNYKNNPNWEASCLENEVILAIGENAGFITYLNKVGTCGFNKYGDTTPTRLEYFQDRIKRMFNNNNADVTIIL
jgi:hypothetical protein